VRTGSDEKMKSTSAPAPIKISDLHLASFLLARGFQVVGVEGPPGKRDFVFQDIPLDAISSFYGGDDAVSARALLDALRNLRGLLVQGVR